MSNEFAIGNSFSFFFRIISVIYALCLNFSHWKKKEKKKTMIINSFTLVNWP